MASTFILKRKTFADPQQQQNKSSLGKKLAIGAGTIAATAGALYGAKRGVFGNNLMLKTNQRLTKMGTSVANFGTKHNFGKVTSFGNNMVNSGAQGSATARVNMIENRLKSVKGKDFKLNAEQRDRAWNKRFNQELGERAGSVKAQNLKTSGEKAWELNNKASDGTMFR